MNARLCGRNESGKGVPFASLERAEVNPIRNRGYFSALAYRAPSEMTNREQQHRGGLALCGSTCVGFGLSSSGGAHVQCLLMHTTKASASRVENAAAKAVGALGCPCMEGCGGFQKTTHAPGSSERLKRGHPTPMAG